MADLPVPGPQLTGATVRVRGRHPGGRAGRPRDAVGRRPRRVRRRRIAARRRPRPPASRTGTSPRTPGRIGSSSSIPGPSTRTASGRSPCATTARCSRSRPSGPTTTTPTSGARTGSSSATRSRWTSPAGTSRSTRWPGARGPGEPPAVVDPYDGRSDIDARLLRAVGDRDGPVRGGRAADGPGGPARDHARIRDRGGRRWPPSRIAPRWSGTSRANGSLPSWTSCSAPRCHRSGSGC